MAIREGVPKAAPALLEPIADLEVNTPGDFLSDVIGDLGTRRAQIRTIEGLDGAQTVRALVPLGETFSYTTALRSITQGGPPTPWSSAITNRFPKGCSEPCFSRLWLGHCRWYRGSFSGLLF